MNFWALSKQAAHRTPAWQQVVAPVLDIGLTHLACLQQAQGLPLPALLPPPPSSSATPSILLSVFLCRVVAGLLLVLCATPGLELQKVDWLSLAYPELDPEVAGWSRCLLSGGGDGIAGNGGNQTPHPLPPGSW